MSLWKEVVTKPQERGLHREGPGPLTLGGRMQGLTGGCVWQQQRTNTDTALQGLGQETREMEWKLVEKQDKVKKKLFGDGGGGRRAVCMPTEMSRGANQ